MEKGEQSGVNEGKLAEFLANMALLRINLYFAEYGAGNAEGRWLVEVPDITSQKHIKTRARTEHIRVLLQLLQERVKSIKADEGNNS